MENKVINNIPEGLWFLDDDDMACRYSKGNLVKLPATTDILEEIKRQVEAAEVFKAFQSIDIKDEYILGYLNVILRDYVNFLGVDNTNLLINKMNLLRDENVIDEKNAIFMTSLGNCIKTNEMENFDELLEQFSSYNQPYFEKAFSNNKGL